MTYGSSNFEQYDDGATPGFRMTHAVQRLILINAAIFVAQLLVNIPLGGRAVLVFNDVPGGIAIDWLAFTPDELLKGYIWQPFTYMFLHAGLSHLFMNMIGLFFFGPDVERVLSTRQFYRFFILCGALGVGAEFILWGLRIAVPGDAPVIVPSVVGASGATMGVLVAFATLYPDREMYLFPIPIRLTARAVVIIFIVLNLVSALSASNISWATHFGGMGVGYLYIKFVPQIRAWFDRRHRGAEPPTEPLDKLGEAVDNIFRFDEEKKRRK
jgi:membrane associated rhomboid family serine protease